MNGSKAVTDKELLAALHRARAFLNEPQFIAADKNLARCFFELYNKAAIRATKEPTTPTHNNSPGLVG